VYVSLCLSLQVPHLLIDILVSLSDILAIIFGITTAILGLGQIVVTCLIRQSRRRSGNPYFHRMVYNIFKADTAKLNRYRERQRYISNTCKCARPWRCHKVPRVVVKARPYPGARMSWLKQTSPQWRLLISGKFLSPMQDFIN